MTGPPPGDAASGRLLAAFTFGLAAGCHRPGSPRAVHTVHWDGVGASHTTATPINPSVDPGAYPEVILRVASREICRQLEVANPSLYAYALRYEGAAVDVPGPEAGAGEWDRFEAGVRDRTLHLRDDASPVSCAVCVDVHGRMWTAMKRYGGGSVDTEAYGPGEPDSPIGDLAAALVSAARTTGWVVYGLPPARRRNV